MRSKIPTRKILRACRKEHSSVDLFIVNPFVSGAVNKQRLMLCIHGSHWMSYNGIKRKVKAVT